jgi:tellurite resistance protein
MLVVVCPSCKAKYKLAEGTKGKKANCKCGHSFVVKTQANDEERFPADSCPNCSQPVLASWATCPYCTLNLNAGNSANTRGSIAPSHSKSIETGEGTILQVSVGNGQTAPNNLPASHAGRPEAGPLLSVGSDSVVKAHIDASTKVTHDNSTTVHGSYVENQTFVHVGSIVQKLTVSFSSEDASQIEHSLPDDVPSLIAIVSHTCRWLIRNDLVRAKQHVAGGATRTLSADHAKHVAKARKLFSPGKSQYEETEYLIAQRHELCDRAISRIHEIANMTGDRSVLADIDALDNCVIAVKNSHKDILWLDSLKSGDPRLRYLRYVLVVACFPLSLIWLLYRLFRHSKVHNLQEALVEELPAIDSDLTRLVDRYEHRITIINILCAVACADGSLDTVEASTLRSAMATFDFDPSDRILVDCMNAWRGYIAQRTTAGMVEQALTSIRVLAGTEDGRRVWNAALAIAESQGGIKAAESTLLRRLRDTLEIHTN